MGNRLRAVSQVWVEKLYEEFTCCEPGTVEYDIGVLVQQMLLSRDPNASRITASLIDRYYWERVDPSGPGFRYQKDDGVFPDLLSVLFGVVFDIAPVIPYNDPKQRTLAKLMRDLRMMPARQDQYGKAGRLVCGEEGRFTEAMDLEWSGLYIDERRQRYVSEAQWKEDCNKWINLSAFLARCMQFNLEMENDLWGKFADIALEEGLETDMAPGITRDTKIMVAALWCSLADGILCDTFVIEMEDSNKQRGLARWQVWGDRLAQLACEDLPSEIKSVVIDAHKKMVALCPELF